MHDHTHHSHTRNHYGWAFGLATALNAALVVAQVAYGLSAHSMALLADAGHNFGDALGLAMAWGAHVLGRSPPNERFTYGYRSLSIYSAFINAVLLLIATGAIAWEAIQRLSEPEEVGTTTMMVVAAGAVVANGLAAWLLMSGQKGDLNVRGAFAHMVADASVSGGVVVGGAVILLTGWAWIDPALSLVISAVIVWGTWHLFNESARLSMDAVPSDIKFREVCGFLEKQRGVASVHDLHVWAMSTTETALTAHLVIPGGHPGDAFLADLQHELAHKFKVGHATFQIELGDAGQCALAPDHIV